MKQQKRDVLDVFGNIVNFLVDAILYILKFLIIKLPVGLYRAFELIINKADEAYLNWKFNMDTIRFGVYNGRRERERERERRGY